MVEIIARVSSVNRKEIIGLGKGSINFVARIKAVGWQQFEVTFRFGFLTMYAIDMKRHFCRPGTNK